MPIILRISRHRSRILMALFGFTNTTTLARSRPVKNIGAMAHRLQANFEYAFDDMGNRTSAAEGGDSQGRNLRRASYAANNLNQYTSRDVPPYLTVLGSAGTNATVSLWANNGSFASTYRR